MKEISTSRGFNFAGIYLVPSRDLTVVQYGVVYRVSLPKVVLTPLSFAQHSLLVAVFIVPFSLKCDVILEEIGKGQC
jgi:hypothetical protein